MTRFANAEDGVKIAYEVSGDGPPIVLAHGFGASRAITWKNTLWIQTLTRSGRCAIAMDCRGHGESGKPHEVEAYEEGRMAADILAVFDDIGIASADVMGYSMGGFLTIRLMQDAGARVRRAVLAGIGGNYFHTSSQWGEMIAEGLLAPDANSITDPQAKEFRTFGERAGNDLVALAACIRRDHRIFSPGELNLLPHQVLVVCGAEDTLTGPPEALADAFAHALAVTVPKRNHHSTVGDRVYKDAVLEFLSG